MPLIPNTPKKKPKLDAPSELHQTAPRRFKKPASVVTVSETEAQAAQDALRAGLIKRLPLDQLVPNTWNPNTLSAEKKDKLWFGLEEVLRHSGKLGQAIVCRPHPTRPGYYEIIDGEQRWEQLNLHKDHPTVIAASTDGVFMADVNVLPNLPEYLARTLTSALNWFHGDQDPDKYPAYLRSLLVDQRLPLPLAERLLPESSSELQRYIEFSEIPITQIDLGVETPPPNSDDKKEEHWLTLTFNVSQEQAGIIELELARIAALLGSGKNLRGRALEMMAVNSSQTPADSITGRSDGV